jgi:hypothetical protein
MALPQNPMSSLTEKAILDNLKTQTENLGQQSSVLKKLADSIMNQRKEFSSLKREMGGIKKQFSSNDDRFAEIRRYFEKTREAQFRERQEKPKNDKEDNKEKGFFRNALSKLFGPSPYQTKLLEETRTIRFYTENTNEDINFIKRQYEDGARRRERELLAEAIAQKLDLSGGSGGGGLLSKLLGAAGLAGLLGTALSALGAGLLSMLKGALDNTLKALEGFKTNQSAGKTPGTGSTSSTIPTPQGGPIPTPMPGAPAPSRGGPVPNPVGNRLPAPDTLRLPGPAGNDPYKPNKTPDVSDAKVKYEVDKNGKVIDKSLKESLKDIFSRDGIKRLLKGGVGLGFLTYMGTTEATAKEEEQGLAAIRAEQDRQMMAPNPEASKLDYRSGTDIESDRVAAQNKEKKKFEFLKYLGLDETLFENLGSQGKSILNNLGNLKMPNGETLGLLPNLGDSSAKELANASDELSKLSDLVSGGNESSVNVNTVNQTSVAGGGQGSINYQNASTQNDHQAWMEYLRRQGTIY